MSGPSTITLPYTFDTRMNGRFILLGLWGSAPLLAAMLAFLHFLDDLEPDALIVLQIILPLMAVADVIIGYVLFRNNKGASGNISPHMITVIPDYFLGVKTKAAEGTFTPQHYKSVQLRLLSGQQGGMGVISLTGVDTAHTLRVASLHADKARDLATLLSRELKLPVSDT